MNGDELAETLRHFKPWWRDISRKRLTKNVTRAEDLFACALVCKVLDLDFPEGREALDTLFQTIDAFFTTRSWSLIYYAIAYDQQDLLRQYCRIEVPASLRNASTLVRYISEDIMRVDALNKAGRDNFLLRQCYTLRLVDTFASACSQERPVQQNWFSFDIIQSFLSFLDHVTRQNGLVVGAVLGELSPSLTMSQWAMLLKEACGFYFGRAVTTLQRLALQGPPMTDMTHGLWCIISQVRYRSSY